MIFEVRWQHDGKLLAAGSYVERADAEARLAQLNAMRDARGITEPRYWIEEIDTTGLFELPSRPTPRERFTTRVDTNKTPGTWTTCHVEVLEGERVVGSYDRNYAMLQTFEPFRQGDRIFALIAPDYTATSVMDLQTGEVVASEEPNSFGFCPVGFYVPDWWDVNDGSVLPGSLHWSEDKEWPSGDFGLVWGCVWGDDSSWKVQYLDLSEVGSGRVRREERFGYVKLASSPDRPAKEFIRCWRWEGRDRVEFMVPTMFDLTSGAQILTDDFNDDE